MSNIDDNLRDILNNYEYGPDWTHDGQSDDEVVSESIQRMIAAIKQAFTDAGWLDTLDYLRYVSDKNRARITDDVKGYFDVLTQSKSLPPIFPKLMSGQEWYDRFEAELETEKPFNAANQHESQLVLLAIGKCDDTARRAAGLTDTEQPQ